MLNNRQLFLLNTAQTSNSPRLLEIEKSEGVYLFGPNGEKYLDLVSGFAVSNIGHRHPKVLEAIQKQIDKYLHVTVYGEFIQAPQVELATELLKCLPKHFESVYFTNSGTEATEGAMKIAKRYTGRSEIIAAKHAYHGSSQGALSLIGNEEYRIKYGPLLPDIHFIEFNDAQELEKITEKTAAVIVESIQGEAGVQVPSSSYMQALKSRCEKTGTLLILDEIQTGFGRTGKLFAFENYGMHPDIILMAKGMGGGMPIGAFISSREIMGVIKDNPMLGHITTFGGHPVSCAAALASLKVIQDENLTDKVEEHSQLFKDSLKHPLIQEVRGMGFMMAIQLDSFERVEKVSQYCAQNGVLIDWFLHCSTALRVAPPLTISREEILHACQVILNGLNEVNL